MALPGPGRCAMRGACGSREIFGTSLPCPANNSPAQEPDNRDLLVKVCGADYAQGLSCCTTDQLKTLQENLSKAEGIIASCPACRNNFHSFFCSFTCSPDQSTFVNVTSTQKVYNGKTAVASVDFLVGQSFGQGFFDSCKSIQNGASNSYAMDLIGGGAKTYPEFFAFLGKETKTLGSPFQINFPLTAPPELSPLNPAPRNCSDNDLSSRCTCIDCPDLCQALPYVPPPNGGPTCHVGFLTCLSFILILAYSIAVVSFIFGFVLQVTIRKRREKVYERMALSSETASLSPRSHTRGLVGAASLSLYLDGDDSTNGQSDSRHLGRGASLLDPMETVQPRQYKLNILMRRVFYQLGLRTASSPWLTFAVVFTLIGLANIGWKKFEVETDPVRLWVAPTSESKVHKDFFDEHFGPFYRTEQIFVTSATEPGSPVLSWDRLKYWFEVEKDIRELQSAEHGYTLEDVCFKPAGPEGACVVQSVTAWFGNDLSSYNETTWATRLDNCARTPVDCLPDFLQPLGPQYVLGGVSTGSHGKNYVVAESMVVNYVVASSTHAELTEKAMEWERTLRSYLLSLRARAPEEAGIHVAFSTDISLEEEINKSSNTDVNIVILSYLAMFFYVSLTLGSGSQSREEDGLITSLFLWARNFPRLFTGGGLTSSSATSIDSRDNPHLFPRLPRDLFTGSKFTLGLFGICLVILAVASSVGLFSAIGVKVTLIIAEVIPFLVLAVGVDNVFILVHELDRQNSLHGPSASAAPQTTFTSNNAMSPTQSRRPPFETAHEQEESVDAASMPVYLSAEERVARTLAKMGPSILLSTITEVLAFSLGAIVPMPAVRNFALYAAGSVLLNAIMQITVFISALTLDLRRVESHRVDCFPCIRLPGRISLPDGPMTGHGKIGKFIRRYYAPFLLKPLVKGVVLLTFTGIFVASVISMQHIELGLDQRLALPSDSYLVDYFNNLAAYLDIGPPVYFVAHDVDVKKRPGQQELCGRFNTCSDFSIANILEAERKRTESSFISEPTAAWIDDFLSFLNPSQGDCCRVRKRDPTLFCAEGDSPRACQPCVDESRWNITLTGLPEDEEFMRFLNQWLITPTTMSCPLGGKASFGSALSLTEAKDDVVGSHFRTFHSPLKTQSDFISAFQAGHRIAEDITRRTGVSVFPYSLFYVFFDQYTHIIAITQEILGLGLASVLLVTALILGSWRTGTIVAGVVALTVVAVMGAMQPLGISLNALSLVNLVISLGIAVEFCAHIARAFMSAGSGLPADHPAGQKERDDRMWVALADVGPSVLSGITFTKLIGMSVLALTRSKLLEIYYFRMWLTLIVSGALHGLVLLPVILSLAGGAGFSQQELDEEWMSSAIRSDYEPFLADDDSVNSD